MIMGLKFMSESQVKSAWERHWDMGGSLEDAASPLGRNLRKQRLKIMLQMLLNIRKKVYTAIDMGCGNGSTLQVLRYAGLDASVGIEYTDKGIQAAEHNGFKRDVDIYQMDAKKTSFDDRQFDLVFSEGLWEHFEDPTPFMDEFIRISNRYIMVIQPNHFSPVGYLMKMGWEILNSEKGGVKEYSFRLEYFTEYLRKRNFKLIEIRSTRFNEQAVMLFERV